MSFDKRGRPLVGHDTPENFLKNAQCHAIFDNFIFRPLTSPIPKSTIFDVFEDLVNKETCGFLPYIFSSDKNNVSGAILASAIKIGSLQRIIIEDVVLVSNPNQRHAIAKHIKLWLNDKDETIEIVIYAMYNDGWKKSLIDEYDYKTHSDRFSIFVTNA